MLNVKVFNQEGAEVKDLELNEAVFGIEPHKQAMFDMVLLQRASLRQGTHKVKNRTEVAGGGRKPDRHVHRPRRPVHVPLLQGRSGSRPPYALRGL